MEMTLGAMDIEWLEMPQLPRMEQIFNRSLKQEERDILWELVEVRTVKEENNGESEEARGDREMGFREQNGRELEDKFIHSVMKNLSPAGGLEHELAVHETSAHLKTLYSESLIHHVSNTEPISSIGNENLCLSLEVTRDLSQLCASQLPSVSFDPSIRESAQLNTSESSISSNLKQCNRDGNVVPQTTEGRTLSPKNNESETNREPLKQKENAVQKVPHMCNVCKKVFKSETNMLRHCEKHSQEISHYCEPCNKIFSTKSKLSLHQKHVHNPVKSSYQCNVCGKEFSSNKILQDHTVEHTDETPHSCEICNKKFKRRNALTVHLKKEHLVVLPYKCDTCGVSFSARRFLDKHFKIHNDNKVFMCAICDKQIIQQGDNIARHMRMHYPYGNSFSN